MTFNTVIRNMGGVIDDLGAIYGGNYYLVTTGGVVALSDVTDSFSNSGITATSHGVHFGSTVSNALFILPVEASCPTAGGSRAISTKSTYSAP